MKMSQTETRIENYNKMDLANLIYNNKKLLKYIEEHNKKWFRYWVKLVCDHFFAVLDLWERNGKQYTFLDILHETNAPQGIIKRAEFFIFNTKEWFTVEEVVDIINDINNDNNDSFLDL